MRVARPSLRVGRVDRCLPKTESGLSLALTFYKIDMEKLKIIRKYFEKYVLLSLIGEFSFFTFGKIVLFYEELPEDIKKEKNVVLDLERVKYLDRYGIMALYRLKRHIERYGRKLMVLDKNLGLLTPSFLKEIEVVQGEGEKWRT